MSVSTIRPMFKQIKENILILVEKIMNKSEPKDDFLFCTYPEKDQLNFGKEVIKSIGFDFLCGRQDITIHPFTSGISLSDVRITTNVNLNSFFESFSSTLHEAGHGMYIQGIAPQYDGTPLANGSSMSIHESQARLWENIVGRGQCFWKYFYPILKKTFPNQLQNITIDNFYQAINKIKPSLIRTEADEITYNLHVFIRFDLELDILDDKLKVKDLPDAWNERYSQDLGILPTNNSNGVLQDVHWYCDLIGGGFQSYTIGNIFSAFFYDAAIKSNPEIPKEIELGKFGTLLSWLKTNIYRYGSKYTANELTELITNGTLPIRPYIEYLCNKYTVIYGL